MEVVAAAAAVAEVGQTLLSSAIHRLRHLPRRRRRHHPCF